jgi:hypothetical protein
MASGSVADHRRLCSDDWLDRCGDLYRLTQEKLKMPIVLLISYAAS